VCTGTLLRPQLDIVDRRHYNQEDSFNDRHQTGDDWIESYRSFATVGIPPKLFKVMKRKNVFIQKFICLFFHMYASTKLMFMVLNSVLNSRRYDVLAFEKLISEKNFSKSSSPS